MADFYIDEEAQRTVDALVARKLAGIKTRPLRRKMGKVYCEDCQYYRCWDWGSEDECGHPTNRNETDTYKYQKIRNIWKPCEQNQYNDCDLFRLKWFRRLLKWLHIDKMYL